MTNISPTWNLDTLYAGGSQSSSLHSAIHHLKEQIQQFNLDSAVRDAKAMQGFESESFLMGAEHSQKVKAAPIKNDSDSKDCVDLASPTAKSRLNREFNEISKIKKSLLDYENIEALCQDLQSFIHCLISQNVEDQEAIKLHSQMVRLKADCDSLGEEMCAGLAKLDEDEFKQLLADTEIKTIAFHLNEKRLRAKEKLSVEQERLVHQLGIDGYQGWNDIYEAFMGQLRIVSPLSANELLSVGQAENRLSHPERHIRQSWFHRWEETWTQHEALFAQMINHLSGFRLNLYGARKWDSILYDPLFCNRMSEKTLHTMWQTIDKHKGSLQKYLGCKAKLLGVKQLAWYDIDAPLPFASQANIPFEEAAQFIIKHFTDFSPSMGKFAQLAFREKWIEAEDRPGKRPGGFCVSFLHEKQSRIFMTYSGTMNNVFTLAHELGHAYHSYVMRDLPFFSQQYRMNVAETASTLAEMITIDSMIEQTQDKKIQLALLDNQLQRAVIFLMNIHARYLFELDFYQERSKGFVLATDLNRLMENAQKNAFGNALSEWHPHFWAAKQHFYFTEVPFYNFPYTFGYLFSLGIYAHLKQKKGADEAYVALLRDSGSLSVEELAYRHLKVNLEEPDFWEGGLKLIESTIASYVKLL